jgi:hypothetical protein
MGPADFISGCQAEHFLSDPTFDGFPHSRLNIESGAAGGTRANVQREICGVANQFAAGSPISTARHARDG